MTECDEMKLAYIMIARSERSMIPLDACVIVVS
jgi:hypothetical protein